MERREQSGDYSDHRRNQRIKISAEGVSKVWSTSPPRSKDYESESDDEHKNKRGDEIAESKGRKRKKDKKKSKKKKSKKKSTKNSSDESDNDKESVEEWEEVTKETLNKGVDDDGDVIGPLPSWSEDIMADGSIRIDYGRNLLPGEGAAMAAYIAEGKRIPRRGEIGLTSNEIEKYEDVGFVMSGTRHRRMEATRLRKENQIYSAEEKRMLNTFSKEERNRKENVIQSQFKELVAKKMQH